MAKQIENYYKLVKEDIREYLKYEYGNKRAIKKEIKENPNFWDDLNDRLSCKDSVTGKASGSYTCNSEEAKKIVTHWKNESIVREAIEEFGVDMSQHYLDWEFLDVTARCYVLSSCISEIQEEFE